MDNDNEAKLAQLDYVMAQFGQHGGWLHRDLKERIRDGRCAGWYVDRRVPNATALRRALRPIMNDSGRATR